MTYELMAREFPRYDQTTLPAIPADWKDISWHNDTCPSFAIGESINVHIDYLNPDDRDEPHDYPRFGMCFDADSDRARWHSTNDWDEVLRLVANPPKPVFYWIRESRDRDLNDTFDVEITDSDDNVIAESGSYYSKDSAHEWLRANYPAAQEA